MPFFDNYNRIFDICRKLFKKWKIKEKNVLTSLHMERRESVLERD